VDHSLLEYDAVLIDNMLRKLWRILLPLCSGSQRGLSTTLVIV